MTAPYTPEQNVIAERFNRITSDKMRCMLFDANLSNGFWAEAVLKAVYIINRLPCKGNNGETPFELWSNKKPDLAAMRVFGCTAMVHVPKEKRRKMDQKSFECVLLGYCAESKAYRLYDQKARKLIVSRDVIFIEDKSSGQVIANQNSNSNFVYLPVVNADTSDLRASNETGDDITPSGVNEGDENENSEESGGTVVSQPINETNENNDEDESNATLNETTNDINEIVEISTDDSTETFVDADDSLQDDSSEEEENISQIETSMLVERVMRRHVYVAQS